MHWAKQAVMSLDKKHENPQSNTASLTMSPSLHKSSKSLVLHCAKEATDFVKESAISIKPMTPKEDTFMTYKLLNDALGSVSHEKHLLFHLLSSRFYTQAVKWYSRNAFGPFIRSNGWPCSKAFVGPQTQFGLVILGQCSSTKKTTPPQKWNPTSLRREEMR